MTGTSGAAAAMAIVRVVIGFPINNQLVINLIGKDDQIVLARQFRNLLEHLACAD